MVDEDNTTGKNFVREHIKIVNKGSSSPTHLQIALENKS